MAVGRGIASRLKWLGKTVLGSPGGYLSPNARLVGQDGRGNTFYEIDTDLGHEPPRRRVEFRDRWTSPKELHPLWFSWVYRDRPTAPTEAEIQKFERDQLNLQHKVKELEKADAKIRLEQQAQLQRDGFNQGPSSSAGAGYFETIMAKMKGDDDGRSQSTSPRESAADSSLDNSSSSVKPPTLTDLGSPNVLEEFFKREAAKMKQRPAAAPEPTREEADESLPRSSKRRQIVDEDSL